MIRLLFIIASLKIGGAEKLVAEMAILMKKRGFAVTVLVIDRTATALLDRLKEDEIKVIHSYRMCIYNPLHIFKIRALLPRYDLLHVHLFPSLYWAACARMMAIKKTSLVYTEHNTSNRRRNKKIWRLFDRFIYGQYGKIITISREVEKALIEHLDLPISHYIRIENGVDLEEIRQASPVDEGFFPSAEPNQKLILQVSSFRWQKDQKTLVRALQHLPENVKLLLAGDGRLRKECEEYVEEMNVSDRVVFLGIRNDIPRLLKAVDLVVLSSNHEGLSLASVEGMASGRPFIASDVPGLREIVKGAGVLFPKGDDKVLATCISSLLADSDYYGRIVQTCLERAKRFDINTMVDRYLSLYEQILKK